MKSIEISTSHNIVLQFQLAGTIERIAAYGVDLIILFITYTLAYYSIALFFTSLHMDAIFWTYLFLFPLVFFYHLGFEVFNNGQSPGKMLLKIKVVSLDGKPVSLNGYIVRWAFRLLDILISFGTVATLSTLISPKSQRIGDLLAGTTVVKTKNDSIWSLDRLLNIGKEDYEPTYPAVKMYTDEDMIMIKELINRLQSNPSEKIKNLAIRLTRQIKSDLQLENERVSVIPFLQKVLDDYIMLTR